VMCCREEGPQIFNKPHTLGFVAVQRCETFFALVRYKAQILSALVVTRVLREAEFSYSTFAYLARGKVSHDCR